MMIILTTLAVLALLTNLYMLLDIGLGIWKMRTLEDIEAQTPESAPLVSVIVPACNEEDTVEPALQSLLALDYKNIEIIVVNDRSTDDTDIVLQAIQQKHPRLKILTITELPKGWLGKNHALQQGAAKARGEYLLFTDADIIFAKSTLSRAVTLMLHENLDHLALIFKNIAKGALLNAMVADAGGGLLFLFKPWRVSEKKSRYYMGVGAFNLVRKSMYEEIGGHKSVKMHPIDDIMLGKIIKHNGYTQECLLALDFLTVHWYSSTREMIHGLMKNIFALYDFRIARAMAGVVMIFWLTVLPQWLVLFGNGILWIVGLLSICVRLLAVVYGTTISRGSCRAVLFSLLSPYVNIYLVLKGVAITIVHNGIEWRGTFYSLDELKNNPSLF